MTSSDSLWSDREYDPSDDDEPVSRYIKRCNRCGERGLAWEDDNGKWILVHRSGKIHKCKQSSIKLDLEKPL